MKINACIDYCDRTKTYYYTKFEVKDSLPEVNSNYVKNIDYKNYNNIVYKIKKLELDAEQPNFDVYNYDYYEVVFFDNEFYFDALEQDEDFDDYCVSIDCQSSEYIAIPKNEN